jgi:carbonic anhydrase
VSSRISTYEAWQRLLDGNERFVSGDSLHPNQNASRRSELVNTQNPFAVIFGCADSRLAAKEAVETGEAPQGHIRDLFERITPSVLKSLGEDKTDVDDMVIEHVKQTVRRLLDSSRMIFDAVDNYSAVVVGVSYRLEEGQAQLVSKSGVL